MIEYILLFLFGLVVGVFIERYDQKNEIKYNGYKVTRRGVFTLIEKDNEP